MAKLTRLAPLVGGLKPRVGYTDGDKAGFERQRRQVYPWRSWYNTARWKALRWSVLVRDNFTCQMPHCGRIEQDTSLLVADHKVPHRGDAALFWDDQNLQCLCKACHDSTKQSLEKNSSSQQWYGG